MSGSEPLSVRSVRRWVRLYTRGLPADEGERRRLELESDLWEHFHDTAEPGTATALLGRFLRGIPADVWWRYRTLLDTRGARQRSHDMTTTTTRTDWWTPVAFVIGVVSTLSALMAGVTSGDGGALALAMAIGSLVGALGLLGGLALLRRHPVRGSWAVIAGSALIGISSLFGLPLSVVVILTGLWTGNLRFSESEDAELRLEVRRNSLSQRWYLWFVAAAVLGGIGFLALLISPSVTPDNCTETNPCWEDTAMWATWILSWLSAFVTAGVGVILAGSRLFVRHRTRLA